MCIFLYKYDVHLYFAAVHTGGSLPNRNGQEPNETNYVPLQTLLADDKTAQMPLKEMHTCCSV